MRRGHWAIFRCLAAAVIVTGTSALAPMSAAQDPQSNCGDEDLVGECLARTDDRESDDDVPPSVAAEGLVITSPVQPAETRLLGSAVRCSPSDAVGECVSSVTTAETSALASIPTGADTAGASLESNKKNFLPFLALTGLLNEGTGTDSSGNVVLDLNSLLRWGGEDSQLKLVANTKPRLSAALREALPEAERDDLSGRIEGELSDLDDTALQFTYSVSGRLFERRFGRRFSEYSDLFRNLSRMAIDTRSLARQVAETAGREGAGAESKLERLEATATARMEQFDLDQFYKLVDNQPQLLFTAERKFRDSLVGPEEFGVKVTYEHGRTNLNELVSTHPCVEESTTPCLVDYLDFVTKRAADLDQGDRFSFSAEYVDVDDDAIDPGIDGIEPLVLESATKLIVSAGWSRRFSFGEGDPVLLDLVAEYQDVSDDPLRRDRGVVTLTLTRNFAGVAVPFGIVYANHGEFLGEVDEQLSAHVGLKFNAFGKPKEK